MSRALAALAALAACGAPAAPARAPSHPAPAHAAAAPPTRAHLCARAKELHAARCAPFDQVDAALFDDCTIADSVFIAAAQGCLDAATCDAAQACMVAVARDGAPFVGPTAACRLPAGAANTVPAGVSARELAASYGRTDRAFADSPSSVAQPIEVCGMPAETGYLTRVTCADGSHPFADRAAAADARTGNAGDGGRCGRVIDEYAVPCPERTYAVFIDAYRCPARAD